MPERDTDTDTTIQDVANASDIRDLLMMLISGLRDVTRGSVCGY